MSETIWYLTDEEVGQLTFALTGANAEALPIRVCIDGGVKVDTGAGWIGPYGKEQPDGQ